MEPIAFTDGKLKPLMVVNVDGGPDENPRFYNTLVAWVYFFKVIFIF